MKKTVFTGAATAIITPFKDNKIDFESFAKWKSLGPILIN